MRLALKQLKLKQPLFLLFRKLHWLLKLTWYGLLNVLYMDFFTFACNSILTKNSNIQCITKWENKKEQLP